MVSLAYTLAGAALAIGLYVILHLLRVVRGPDLEGTLCDTSMSCSSVGRIAEHLPMTAIKIVLVVWQIVTQVGHGSYLRGGLQLESPNKPCVAWVTLSAV